jgi:hypothetical protein
MIVVAHTWVHQHDAHDSFYHTFWCVTAGVGGEVPVCGVFRTKLLLREAMFCCLAVMLADNLIHATYMGPTGEQD